METCYNDIASASLPPLVDNYIAFDQPGPGGDLEGYEQVPCFSNPSQPPSSMIGMPAVQGQQMGKAIKDVLNQFTRFESTTVKRELQPHQSFGQDGFESYLAESGFSQMWNSFN